MQSTYIQAIQSGINLGGGQDKLPKAHLLTKRFLNLVFFIDITLFHGTTDMIIASN